MRVPAFRYSHTLSAWQEVCERGHLAIGGVWGRVEGGPAFPHDSSHES